MSDTLIGVVIGGALASVSPIAQLIFNHLHWKRDAKLAYLKEERLEFETNAYEVLALLAEHLTGGLISAPLHCKLFVMMPKSASDLFMNYLESSDRSDNAKRALYFAMSVELTKAIDERNKAIRDLVS